MMKKIIALMLALMVSTTVIASSFKVNATAVPASLLAYLIQCCAEILVGSETVTQQQFDNMSTTDIFDTTKSVAPNVNFSSLPRNPFDSLNMFLMQLIADNPEIYLPGLLFKDFVLGHFGDLDTSVDDSVLNGYDCAYFIPRGNSFLKIFGKNGVFEKDGSVFLTMQFIISENGVGSVFEGNSSHIYNSSYIYYGNWKYEDGTAAPTDTLPIVSPMIGTVDVDGTKYDVNGDGTVTIDDTTYTINDDGSITIDGKTYYPDYDISPYNDQALLDLLLKILSEIQVKDDSNIDDLVDDTDIDVPDEIANSELSSLTMPKTIATVFPFCIPWDFYNGIKMLSEEPEAPKFEVPFEIPQYGSFPGLKKMIVIDFSKYSSAFAVVRWTFFTLFMISLCFITFKIVKGA